MSEKPLVGVVMGSKSDYEVLSAAVEILRALEIPHEARIVSAHRTPDWLFKYAETARERGLRVIIAGAGGAAHLPGMLAAKTLVPVLGVPVPATAAEWNGLAAFDRADAQGRASGNARDRQAGRGQCGAAGGRDSGRTTDAALYDRLAAWRAARTQEVLEQTLEQESRD